MEIAMRIMVNDEFNWKRGEIATVLDTREICGVTVYWVAVPSGPTATVEFAIRADKTLPVLEIEDV
jgi:hypothetical protein